MRILGVVLALVLAAPAAAVAQDDAGDPDDVFGDDPAGGVLPPAPDEDDGLTEEDLSHTGKAIIGLQLGLGLRAIAPYDDGVFCGDLTDEGETSDVCVGRSPFTLDLNLAWAPNDRVELMVELRFGLERDFGVDRSSDGPRVLGLGLGPKIYFSDVGRMRFFSTLEFFADFGGYEQIDENDVGIKNTNGIQLDVHETAGFYFWFGEYIGFKRWLSAQVEAGIGIQARFP